MNAIPSPHMTHLALHVRDLEAMVAFYCGFCGMVPVHEREDGEHARDCDHAARTVVCSCRRLAQRSLPLLTPSANAP